MRRWIVVVVGVLLVAGTVTVGAVWGIRSLWHAANNAFTAPACTFGTYSLTNSQTSVASTMVGVVTERGLPERADLLVLMAAMQESHLTNVPAGEGDRDSVGVLQQRPSQGWGTVAQLSDVRYATGAFLDALVKIDGWQSMDPATAIQEVQVSADGSAYAQHQPLAQALADALSGTKPAGVWCEFDKPTSPSTTATVVDAVQKQLPVNPPTVTGRTITVPGAHWQTAAWFVANAEKYGIERVSYDGKTWKRNENWVADKTAGNSAVVAVVAAPEKKS